MNNHGYVLHNNKELYLTQNAYVSDCGKYYKCHAMAMDDNETIFEYEIKWPVINFNCDDQSDSCDWDNYTVLELGESLT